MAATQYRTLTNIGSEYTHTLEKCVEILNDLITHSGNNWPQDLAITNLFMVGGRFYYDLTDNIPGGQESLDYYEVESLGQI